MKEKAIYKSKKFWALVLSVLLAVARGFGAEVPEEAFYSLMAYMLGQGIADHGKAGRGHAGAD